jgi:hypothetical protein
MTPDETAALAKLGGRAAAGLASHVQQIHRSVSRRVYASPVLEGHRDWVTSQHQTRQSPP